MRQRERTTNKKTCNFQGRKPGISTTVRVARLPQRRTPLRQTSPTRASPTISSRFASSPTRLAAVAGDERNCLHRVLHGSRGGFTSRHTHVLEEETCFCFQSRALMGPSESKACSNSGRRGRPVALRFDASSDDRGAGSVQVYLDQHGCV